MCPKASEHGPDGITIADYHAIDSSDITQFRGNAKAASGPNECEPGFWARTGDLKGGGTTRFSEGTVGQERSAPSSLTLANPRGHNSWR